MTGDSPWGEFFTLWNIWGSNISPVKKEITIVIFHLGEEERHCSPHAHLYFTDFVGFETHFWVCVFYHCSDRLGDIMTADVLLIVIVVEPFQLVAAARSMSL